jgi:PAS domain S-box-containing protein
VAQKTVSPEEVAVVLMDAELHVSYCNPAAESLFGPGAAALVGDDNKKFSLREIRRLARPSGSHSFVFSLAETALPQSIEATFAVIEKSSYDQPPGWMLTARDVSKRLAREQHMSQTLCELQAIFDNTLLGLILTRNGIITRINATCVEMFGYDAPSLKGTKWADFQSETATSEETECITGSNRVVHLRHSQGKMFWALVRQMDIEDARHNAVLYLFEDVTRRREMFTTIRQLSQAVEQSSNSIIITDTDGNIKYVNKAFVTITGYSAQEAIGLTPAVLKSGKTPLSVYKEMWKTITGGREWSGDFINKKKNGDLYEEHVVVSPLRNENGAITHFVATKENISDLKKARLRAESANQAKSTFLANMSHEIRTPMNAILGMSELLLTTELASEQRKYLCTVNSSANHLLSIINDVLDYSKIEVDQLILEEGDFNPAEIIEEVVSTLGLQAEQKGILLKQHLDSAAERPCLYRGDALRLKQVLLNLVGNAIKFTDRGRVDVELSIHATQGVARHELQFRVRDTGLGLSVKQQQEIFKRFTQTDASATRKFGGTGLGLAISHRLVEMMGDHLRVTSTLHKGSEFFFSLSLECGAGQIAKPKEEKQALVSDAVGSLSILLVEDNLANQQLAGVLLENMGHDVEIAEDGLVALHCLSEHSYDLILMDIQMPVMDGFTATRYIREFETEGRVELPEDPSLSQKLQHKLAGGHCSIVAMTATVLTEEQQTGVEGGLDAYLSKPYSQESLGAVLQRFIGSTTVEHEKAVVNHDGQEISVAAIEGHLSSSYDLDREDVLTIIETYSVTLLETLQKLQQAVAGNEREEGVACAHSLKGACLNLGLQELAERASLLEKELRQDILAHHGGNVEYLHRALEPLLKPS